ncbi:MAG TPA: hypothetical protein VFE55_14290 [Acidimicrobiia bacterium]|nr:hypothetical protein [Acidimicrobiia bacterium]
MPVLTLMRAQSQRAVGFALIAIGAVVLAVGWLSVSGSSTRQEQLSYLVSAGLGGLVCLGLGVTAVLYAGLQDEAAKLAELARACGLPGPPGSSENGFTSRRLVPAVLAGGAAAAVVGIGWNQAAAASDERGAVPGLAVGIAGLIVLSGAAAVRLLRVRAGVETRKAAVLVPLAARYRPATVLDLSADRATWSSAAPAAGTVLVAPGLSRFHREGCPTLADLEVTAVRLADVDPTLRPCRICEAPTP